MLREARLHNFWIWTTKKLNIKEIICPAKQGKKNYGKTKCCPKCSIFTASKPRVWGAGPRPLNPHLIKSTHPSWVTNVRYGETLVPCPESIVPLDQIMKPTILFPLFLFVCGNHLEFVYVWFNQTKAKNNQCRSISSKLDLWKFCSTSGVVDPHTENMKFDLNYGSHKLDS